MELSVFAAVGTLLLLGGLGLRFASRGRETRG
jgi:hypothetical protein